MKILVVDDELDLCEILQFNLETEGYEVVTANSAEEAFKLPLQEYALILLDVMMGEMSLRKTQQRRRSPLSSSQLSTTKTTRSRGLTSVPTTILPSR